MDCSTHVEAFIVSEPITGSFGADAFAHLEGNDLSTFDDEDMTLLLRTRPAVGRKRRDQGFAIVVVGLRHGFSACCRQRAISTTLAFVLTAKISAMVSKGRR